MNNNRSNLILGQTFIAIGGILASVGLGMATWSIVWASGTRSTEGTVIKMVHSAGNAGQPVRRRGATHTGKSGSKPVVEYVVAGKNYEVLGLLTTSPPAYRVGDKTSVLYKPQSPAEATIDTFINRWLLPTIFGGIAVCSP